MVRLFVRRALLLITQTAPEEIPSAKPPAVVLEALEVLEAVVVLEVTAPAAVVVLVERQI